MNGSGGRAQAAAGKRQQAVAAEAQQSGCCTGASVRGAQCGAQAAASALRLQEESCALPQQALRLPASCQSLLKLPKVGDGCWTS